jgi:hypothetical protein
LNVNTTAIVAPAVTGDGVKLALDCPAFAAAGVTVNELLDVVAPLADAVIVKPVPALVTDSPVNVATPETAALFSVPRRSPPLIVRVTTSSALPIFCPAEFNSSTDTENVWPAVPDVGCTVKRSPATGVSFPPLIVPLPQAFAANRRTAALAMERHDFMNVVLIYPPKPKLRPPFAT